MLYRLETCYVYTTTTIMYMYLKSFKKVDASCEQNTAYQYPHKSRQGLVHIIHAVPPSCSPIFQYKYSHFSVLCIHFRAFYYSEHLQRAPYYYVMYVLNSPSFQYFWNFISIYGQNSVKILINPYTWRHCTCMHKVCRCWWLRYHIVEWKGTFAINLCL